MASLSSPRPASASPPLLRIVSLSQGATEAVCALGLEHCIVGRSHECTGPRSILALPCVSFTGGTDFSQRSSSFGEVMQNSLAGHKVNWELLQELKPDLIFTQNQMLVDRRLTPSAARHLHWEPNRMCTVVLLHSHTIDDVMHNLETIAEFCNAQEEGAKLVRQLRNDWKTLKQKTPQWADGMPRVSVVCLSSLSPLIAAGYWIPEIISCAGGSSMFGRAGCPGVSLTLGDLLETNPDVLLYFCHGMPIKRLAKEASWLDMSQQWRQLRAIKGNRFFIVDADRFFIDSAPNVVRSAEMVAEILHGFGFGYEEKGFLRWEGTHNSTLERKEVSPKKVHGESSRGVPMKELPIDIQPKQNSYEVAKTAFTVHNDVPDESLHATEVCEIKRAVSAGGKIEPLDSLKPSLCDVDACFVEVKQKDSFRQACCERLDIKVETPSCRNTKDLECNLLNAADNSLVHHAKSRSFSWRDSSEKAYSQQDVICKIWASTRSAAAARACHSVPSSSKARSLDKSISAPASSRGLVPRTQTIDFLLTDESKMLRKCRKSPKVNELPSYSGNDYNHLNSVCAGFRTKTMTTSLSMPAKVHDDRRRQMLAGKQMGRQNSEKKESKVLPIDRVLRQAHGLHDMVLASLAEIGGADCLLLSGGLASSILAEAAPSADSGGFKVGITVLSGPTATDRAFAEDVAKRCKMEHSVIGDLDKGNAVTLLAKELAFVVETLKTFSPLQVRNGVPIAAALREAKRRGIHTVVTGDGTDDLFSIESSTSRSLNKVPSMHCITSKLIQRNAVILGEALGVKVLHPFLQPKLLDYCKSLSCSEMDSYGTEAVLHERVPLRRAFPEVAAAGRAKDMVEVGSGISSVSEYFSTAVSTSMLKNNAKRIYQKDKICIRDAEHLVYYRAFRRIFKGKVPKGMTRWESMPCTGCGYQLSLDLHTCCLVCGQALDTYNDEQAKRYKTKHVQESKSDNVATYQPLTSVTRLEEWRSEDNTEASNKSGGSAKKVELSRSTEKPTRGDKNCSKGVKGLPAGKPKVSPKGQRPQEARRINYLAVLGAGSAALLLLLQMSRR